ncbi:MAG: helicase-related protein [Armatimonadota bacterium]|nr:helicase-related protein [Armatimonadota bacterium]
MSDQPGKLSTILDNRDGNNVLSALRTLLAEAQQADIATGTFEIGSLLALDGAWQDVPAFRVIMGDETTGRTRRVLLEALTNTTDDNLELVKERDDTLRGLAAVRNALESKQLKVRVYPKAKFHPKCYLVRTKPSQLVDCAIVGSSNFTEPGLTVNVELNLLTTDQLHLDALWQWYERVWKESEDAALEVLKVIERHLRAYSPLEVWAKALYEFFAGREAPLTEWEERESVVFPLLSKYQQDAYRQARAIADTWGGAFICDGVGLGKTYEGAMLLEYHLRQGHRTLVLTPRSARSVWESEQRDDPVRLLRANYRRAFRDVVTVLNHTDFGREGTISDDDFEYYRDFAQVVLIDEAHHFRTPSAYRSKRLRALLEGGSKKRVYFLTATPINNSLRDLYHLINYIARDQKAYFAALGIGNFDAYFSQAEKRLERMLETGDGEPDIQTAAQDADILRNDQLLHALVIQRSRAYVIDAEKATGDPPLFPVREKPQVIAYSLLKVYKGLFDDLKTAFDKDDPLLTLALYNPEVYRRGDKDSQLLNRDKQVVGLIRTLLLKRLESSYRAFESSLEELLRKMAAFVREYAPDAWEAWRNSNASEWETVQLHQSERRDEGEEEGNELDDVKVAALEAPAADYDMDPLIDAVRDDMALVAGLLARVYADLSPKTDDKLQTLVRRLKTDPILKDRKVVIFTEFRDTARYIWKQLTDVHQFERVEELDSTRDANREDVIKRFAPYYNCREDELAACVANHIRVLVTTDVLSEGLNLQDANLIVNYDLHWNPVRLMQRIGRVDRRLKPTVEMQLGRWGGEPHKVYVFNFLPPDELNDLLRLFQAVTGKLLRISKTLGIEAPVLTPDDDFEALRLFNERYIGQKSDEERMRGELDAIAKDHPELYAELQGFPRRLFSGKPAPEDGVLGLFCCYRYPAMQEGLQGEVRWYFRSHSGEIWESERLKDIADAIRSTRETQRKTKASAEDLKEWRLDIEPRVQKHMRDIQAPMGTKAVLVCWMEVG